MYIDIFLLIGITHDGLSKEGIIDIFERVSYPSEKTEQGLIELCDISFIQKGKKIKDSDPVYCVP